MRFILFGFVAVIAVCVFAASYQATKSIQSQTPPAKPSFGQFPAYTAAERELEKMLVGKDEGIDLALANWLVATDVPQFSSLTGEDYFKRLESMTQHVRQEMTRRQEVAKSKGKNPNDPAIRSATFCGAMITLGFAYREEFAEHDLTPQKMRGLYADANNVFLAGLLQTMRGTCVTMPLIYVVIGQRLGLPVHFVHIGKHCFARWEEPGYRINIETTAVDKVWVTDDDAAYIEDEKMTRAQVTGNELRNLSNREIIASLLFIRSSHRVMKPEQEHRESWIDLSRAFHLSPEDPAIVKTHQAVFARYDVKPEHTVSDIERIEAAMRRVIEPEMLPPPFGKAQPVGSRIYEPPQQQPGVGFNPTPVTTGPLSQWSFGQPTPRQTTPGRPN